MRGGGGGFLAEDTFGDRVRALRIEVGLSQDELASRMPEPHHLSWVSKVERGEQEPALADLIGLAAALQTDVRWLLTGEASGMTEFTARMSELELELDGRAVRAILAVALQQVAELREERERGDAV